MRKNIDESECEEDHSREILPELRWDIDKYGRNFEKNGKDHDWKSKWECHYIGIPFSLFSYWACEDNRQDGENTWCEDRENSGDQRDECEREWEHRITW
jgi:hypothetical protein